MIAPQEIELGQSIAFEGYADDYGNSVVGIQFSLDGGREWATFDTSDASSDLWIHWRYEVKPEKRGDYQLKVRSVDANGKKSPAAAVVSFAVV